MKFNFQLINLFLGYSKENNSKLYSLLPGKLIKLEHCPSSVQILGFAYVRVDIFPLPIAV